MWPFFIVIFFVFILVTIVLIFYVSPELPQVVFGPTGSTGPTDYEELLLTNVQFFDGLASVASNVHVSFVKVGAEVTLTINGFGFSDGALPRTGEIASPGTVPINMRPQDTVNMMLTTVSNARKIGMLSITSGGDLLIFVNAQVNNLISGDSWSASGNSAGNVSTSYTIL